MLEERRPLYLIPLPREKPEREREREKEKRGLKEGARFFFRSSNRLFLFVFCLSEFIFDLKEMFSLIGIYSKMERGYLYYVSRSINRSFDKKKSSI